MNYSTATGRNRYVDHAIDAWRSRKRVAFLGGFKTARDISRMPHDQQTLTTMRILDCPLTKHQDPDTLGAHLCDIKSKLEEVQSSLEKQLDPQEVLTADEKMLVAIDALMTQMTSLTTVIAQVAARQETDSAEIKYVFEVLERLSPPPTG